MKKTSIMRNCEKCSTAFLVHQYSIKKGYGRFCSLKCKGKIGGQTKLGKNKNCSVCRLAFYVPRCDNGKRKFCSRKCYHTSTLGRSPHNKGVPMPEEQKIKVSISRAGKMTGNSNHSWRGGITPENKKIRNSIEYRLWRGAVFARDNFTCVKCFIRGGKLHADHISPFSISPSLRFAIDNGQTLCVGCHRQKTTKDLVVIRAMKCGKIEQA